MYVLPLPGRNSCPGAIPTGNIDAELPLSITMSIRSLPASTHLCHAGVDCTDIKLDNVDGDVGADLASDPVNGDSSSSPLPWGLRGVLM